MTSTGERVVVVLPALLLLAGCGESTPPVSLAPPAARVKASGFSQKRCNPAAAHSTTLSAWAEVLLEMQTASRPPAVSRASRLG